MSNAVPVITNEPRRGSSALPEPAMFDSDPLPAAIGRIARIVSSTLELKEVFSQVADAAGAVLPFETMGVCRLESPNILRLYAVAGSAKDEKDEDSTHFVTLEDFSPAMRPEPGEPKRFGDAVTALDPRFAMDRQILESGVRSGLGAPLMSGRRLAGEVWFTSSRPEAFTVRHEKAARAIADILSLSLEHERLWSLDASRRRRLDAIDTLLPAMAETLDLRGVFDRVSGIVHPVLPHDRLILTSLSEDGRELIVEASSGEPAPGMPERFPAGDRGDGILPEYVLIPDIRDQPEGCGARMGCLQLGMRSFLALPLHVDGSTNWLLVLSRTPSQYSEEDVIVGRRVADHVSLALSHQRLAAEERRAAEARERASLLEQRVQVLKDELESSLGYRRVIGEAASWKEALTQAAKVAQTETTVLLTGESGTGKEVVARFIHRGSRRASGPFVALNCAALPETLLESELFGHERGAFTGAISARAGRIEQASGGVLFLDEVAEMTPAVQAKLLRVLQEREYQRLGGTRPLKADVRIVSATNRNLEGALARGEFREDLYYRLRVFEIRLPPLRERRQDILPMAEAFLEEIGLVVGRRAAGISREAADTLLSYGWPGNVRELRNALERATILCDGGLIVADHLPIRVTLPARAGGDGAARPVTPDGVTLKDAERDLIARALHDSGNNVSRAARLLGITRSQLYTRMRRHHLDA